MKKTFFYSFLFSVVFLPTTSFADENKLDLMLRGVVSEAPTAKAMLSKSIAASETASTVDVLVKSSDPLLTAANIESSGGSVGAIAGDILVVTIPMGFLTTLSDFEEVEYIEASKRLTSKMDTAKSHTNADDLQSGSATGSALTGNEVIIGIVDDGLDYGNAAFTGSDGTTRVQFVRQRTTNGSFRICVKSQIDDGDCTITDGGQGTFHGTHVAGIATSSDSTYKGVAPAADLIFIFNSAQDAETDGATTDVTTFSGAVVEGVTQVFRGADRLEKAAVVNLSLGTSLGAHDDTSLLEQGLNSLCTGTGRACVNAAGNENVNALVVGPGAGGIHADVSVASGSAIAWRFGVINASISTFGGATVDIWLTQGDDCTIETRAYLAGTDSAVGSARTSAGPVNVTSDASSSDNTSNDGTAVLAIAVDAEDANNSRPHAQVTLTKTTSASWNTILTDGVDEGYVFDVIVRPTSGSCTGSMWLYPDQTGINDFLQNIEGNEVTGTNSYTLADGDSDKTITIPGTASSVITAGSYMQEKPLNSGASQWTDINNTVHNQTDENDDGTGGTIDTVSLFSSLGPTGEVSGARTKPDVVAPGEPIISTLARSATSVTSTTKVSSSHHKLEGTSMSAPMVTGIIALLFEYNNTLTAADVKNLLRNSAVRFTGQTGANASAGSGKVDAAGAAALTSADNSAFSGDRDLTTDDVDDTGIKTGSSGGGGCGSALVPSSSRHAFLSIFFFLVPLMFLWFCRLRLLKVS